MDTIKIHKQNEVYLYLITSPSIDRELSEYFKFRVPGYQFMPSYRNRTWDGFIRLYNTFTKQIYVGLLPRIVKFAEDRNYPVEFDDGVVPQNKVDRDSIEDFIGELEPRNEKGAVLNPHEYQVDAVHEAIKWNRRLVLSPTSSGKSLMIYSLLRWYDVKTLLVVPNVGLVQQMYSDIGEYSAKDKTFDAYKRCHKIYQGQSKNSDKQIYISTWQSVYKSQKKYFSQFDMIIVDEAHSAKADSLKGILQKAESCKYKFGFTGTLDGTETHQLVLEGLFGPVYKTITTSELMDQGRVSELDIKCVVLKYPETVVKELVRAPYEEEKKFIFADQQRNNFIVNLAIGMKSNCLVLYDRTKHGQKLFDDIRDKAADGRKVFMVFGKTAAEERERIRKLVEKEKDAIIVAQVKTFKEGINIKNLEDIIFASPSKARIRTLQAIGRSLRIGRSNEARLWDIVDDLSHKSYKNFALKHFLNRIDIYNSEKFKYNIYKVDLDG